MLVMVQKSHHVGNFHCNMLAICHCLFPAILARVCYIRGSNFLSTPPGCSFFLWLGSWPCFYLSLSISQCLCQSAIPALHPFDYNMCFVLPGQPTRRDFPPFHREMEVQRKAVTCPPYHRFRGEVRLRTHFFLGFLLSSPFVLYDEQLS